MSELTDWYIDLMINHEYYNHYGDEYEDEDIYWTKRDGSEIRVKDMSDAHIKNTLNLS